MFAGEGEPLLHKELDEIIEHCNNVGISSSVTTNFVFLNEGNVDKIFKNASWVKISINAGTKETYSNIHRTKEEDFDKVIQNMKLAVKVRKENKAKNLLTTKLKFSGNANRNLATEISHLKEEAKKHREEAKKHREEARKFGLPLISQKCSLDVVDGDISFRSEKDGKLIKQGTIHVTINKGKIVKAYTSTRVNKVYKKIPVTLLVKK